MSRLRAAVAIAGTAICGALSVGAPPVDPSDARQLGQTDKQEVKAASGSSDAGSWLGAEATAALAGALRADREARRATEEVHSPLSARQMEAMDRHAQADYSMEISQETKLDHVLDSMMREADLESRVVENDEATMDKSVWQAKAGDGKELANFERELTRVEKEDGEAVRKLERREREEAAKFAEEERLQRRGAKQLQDADRKVGIARIRTKRDQRRRVALEAETRGRLWREADAMRQKAMRSGGNLSEEDVLHLLDVDKVFYHRIIWNMNTWRPEDASLFDRVRLESAAASARMLEAVKRKVDVFHGPQLEGYDTRQFLGLLGRLVNDTKSEIGALQEASDTILGRLVRWDAANPERFTYVLAMALKGVTGNVEFRNHLLKLDPARFSQANATEACGLLGDMLEFNMQPTYRSLGRMRDALDNMSTIVPSVARNMPASVQETVANCTANVLNMAYAEHMAFTEAATAILQGVAPVVLQRLHCDLKSASLPSRIGTAAAALAAAVAWLAQ